MLNYYSYIVVCNVVIKVVFAVSCRLIIQMPVFIYISWGLACAYALLMVLYKMGWGKQPSFWIDSSYMPTTKISVIIPARNEEVNIEACLNSVLAQDYPRYLLQVIVVDDYSTDNTAAIIKSFSIQGVQYVSLAEHLQQNENIVAYKKLALAAGIAISNGDLVVTTDADCTAGRDWLKNIAAIYEQQRPVMVVAPVNFTNDNSVVQLFQSLDFMSMQGITAATLQLKLGNMCNGANLAFSKTAYEEVGGYKDIDHIASGDDYLLMTKLATRYPDKISFLKSADAIVDTPPQPGWKAFLQQRIRWASKSGKYGDHKLTAVLMLVYLFNLLFLPLLIFVLLHNEYLFHFAGILAVKILFEIMYLRPVSSFFNKRRQLWVFPFLQPMHIAYIITAGLMGFAGVYQWKGRSVR